MDKNSSSKLSPAEKLIVENMFKQHQTKVAHDASHKKFVADRNKLEKPCRPTPNGHTG